MGKVVTESNHGGGVYGRMTVEVKQAFFDEVKNQLRGAGRGELAEGLRYNELFQLSAGTSFGALSTIGMSKIKGRDPYFSSPGEMGTFMDKAAPKIFPYHDSFVGKLLHDPRQILDGVAGITKYSNRPLRGMVQDIVGIDTRMADVEDDIMLTMTKVHPNLDAMFAKSHVARGEVTEIDGLDDAKRKNWLLWEVALGSASPTTFFPGVSLTNPDRDGRIVVIDGGQSGWNNPTIPTLAEATFMYGSETTDETECLIINTKNRTMYGTPHDIIHIHWGTGDFNSGVPYDDAIKNSLLSMKNVLVASSMQSVSKYSLREGQRQLEHFFNFDILMDDVPEDIRPHPNFVLSTDEQMYRLKQTGLFAAEKLSEQIKEAAALVAGAYIERVDYEKDHPGESYKDHLRAGAPCI
tara:strand:- start:9520 stop:10743 length:1224 start_codon:yes stop_codon:yes gene_type:complete